MKRLLLLVIFEFTRPVRDRRARHKNNGRASHIRLLLRPVNIGRAEVQAGRCDNCPETMLLVRLHHVFDRCRVSSPDTWLKLIASKLRNRERTRSLESRYGVSSTTNSVGLGFDACRFVDRGRDSRSRDDITDAVTTKIGLAQSPHVAVRVDEDVTAQRSALTALPHSA